MNVRLVSDSFLFEHITLTADDAEKAELVIGRSHRADYHIDHPQVSGLQCTLKVDMKPPHKLTLKDTSTNGTFVDGREIGRDKTVELTAGCTVTFLVNTVEEKDLEFTQTVEKHCQFRQSKNCYVDVHKFLDKKCMTVFITLSKGKEIE